MEILAALLKVLAPVVAGLIATEYTKVIALVQRYGGIAVAIAGVVYGFAANYVMAHIPGLVLPADFTSLTADTWTGILTGLIALLTHTQASLPKARAARGLKF